MRTKREIFTDLFCNPDGSGSTKRTAGWVCLIVGIIFGIIISFVQVVDIAIASMVFITIISSGLSAFGLSSIDLKTLNNK